MNKKLYDALIKGFTDVINRNCAENEANIPDFIIAEALVRCYNGLNYAMKARDKWYSVNLEPANSRFTDGER